MKLAEIFTAVRPDTRELPGDLRKALAKSGTEKLGKNEGNKFGSGFTSSIKRVAGVAAGIFGAVKVKDFLATATKGYRDHLKVASVTNQVIKTTGGAARISATGVGKLADAIERKTGVDGDAIQSGENLLLTFTNVRNEAGKGNQIFSRASGLLADMSVALGQDAKGSAIQLGKALNDPVKGVTALSRVGVSFTAQQVKQITKMTEANNTLGAQKIILAELQKEFGGAAAAAADPGDRAIVTGRQIQDSIGAVALPAVRNLAGGFADFLGPAILDIADKKGPQLTAFFAKLGGQIPATFALLLNGDFNGRVGKALGGLSEDSPYVLGVLTLRDNIISVYNSFQLLASGNFTQRIFGQEEDSAYVGFLLKVHTGIQGLYETMRLMVTGDFRGKLFGQSEDSGFVDLLFRARDALGQLATNARNLNWSAIGAQGKQAATDLGQLLPVVQEFRNDLPGVTDLLHVGSDALHFLAQHTDELRKAMPLLVGAFIAYKIAQAGANVAALAAVPIKVGEIITNRQLAASNRALIASRIENTVATGAETTATFAETSAKNVGLLTSIRMRAAILGQAIASKAVRAATIAWTGVQWLLNAALTANPIGIVVVAIGLLVAGFILAWKHSQTFRTIVTGAFNGVKTVAVTVLSFVWTTISGFFQNLLNGAAKAFGWVPGLGGKLKSAATEFGKFRDSVNSKLAGIKDKSVTVTPTIKNVTYTVAGVTHTTPLNVIGSAGRSADGGPTSRFFGKVRGNGTPTSDNVPIMVSPTEWVIRGKASSKYGDYAMGSVNRGTATIIPDSQPGFARGGRPGMTLRTPLPSAGTVQGVATGAVNTAARLATPLATQLAGQVASAVLGKMGISPGLLNTVAFGKSQAGKPYVWGAAGPGGYDCSGFVSALVNYAYGRSPYHRLGATGSMPWASMAAGTGPFMVGWFKGNPGHTAATINGVNFESAGGVGTRYGPGARGAYDRLFNQRRKIKGFAGGGRPGRESRDGDGPFDLLDPRGKRFVGSDALRQLGFDSYASGAWKIAGDRLAMVHSGEMILPERNAATLRRYITQRMHRAHLLHLAHQAHSEHINHLTHLNHTDARDLSLAQFTRQQRPQARQAAVDATRRLHPDDIRALAKALAIENARRPVVTYVDSRRVDSAMAATALGGAYDG